MATNVSNEYKAMCKSNAPSGALGRVIVLEENPNNNIEITENNDIQKIAIEDNCYVNDKFIGTAVAKKITVELFNDGNIYDLENKEIESRLGFNIDSTEELVSFGNFIIGKPDTEEVQAKTKFIGYDYMVKFDVPFVDNNIYPIELGTYFSNLCTQVGLVAGNTNFTNSTYMVKGNPFTNNEDCRTVLSAIAQIAGGIAKIGRDNKPYIINLSKGNAVETIDGNNYDTFNPNKVFGPINKVIIKMNSGVDGEESVRSDLESIAQNGECAVTISDNPILNNQEERELVISNIFNMLDGITYLPFKTTYYGYPYSDSIDKISILNVNDINYTSYIFNHNILFDGAFSGSIETPALTKTQSMYKNTNDLKTKFRKVEQSVDKINGEIASVVEEATETNEKISEQKIEIGQISSKVEETTANINTLTNETEAIKSEINTVKQTIGGLQVETEAKGGNNIFMYSMDYWDRKRPIKVGDNLSGQTLTFDFTDNLEIEDEADISVITGMDSKNQIREFSNYGISSPYRKIVSIYDVNTEEPDVEIYKEEYFTLIQNLKEYRLSNNFGIVAQIYENSASYKYISADKSKVLEEKIGDSEFISNSVSGYGYAVGEGISKQIVELKNGIYTVSFNYKKIINSATTAVKINSVVYDLTSANWTEFKATIKVTTNKLEIEFNSNTDSSLYISDLLGNIGTEKQVWSQNPNETRTDAVTIGKGIKVENTKAKTYTKIDADGTRIFNKNTNNVTSEFTDKGTETEELLVKGQAQISGVLQQIVGSQTWFSSLL